MSNPSKQRGLRARKPAASKSANSKKPVRSAARLRAPVAEKRPVSTVRHGVAIVDDYAWLRAENWQDVLRDGKQLPADIRAYLEAENQYTAQVLTETKSLQRKLVRELRGRIVEDDEGVPAPDGPWAYYHRYREGADHPLICRKPRDGGRGQTLLDSDRLAKGKRFFDLGETSHSPSHTLLAWSADEAGSEFHTIRVRDLKTGKDLPDQIDDTDGDIVWTANSRAFYYTRVDEKCRPRSIYRHTLGSDPADDVLIYHEKGTRWHMNLNQTQSGRFAMIEIADQETSEVWLIDLRKSNASAVLVEPRKKKIQYDVEDHGKTLLIVTNADRAEDFKIMQAPLDAPGRANWRDLIPYRRGCMITGMSAFKRHLVRTELEDGLPSIVVRDMRSGAEHTISFDEESYDLDTGTVLEFDTDIIRLVYSSLTTPQIVYDYNMKTRERTVRKRRRIPSGHNPKNYITRRTFATSHDGKTIPVSILHARNTKIDGSAPLVLNAYGAYGHAYEAAFGANRLSLVDRGIVYAIAHIRGGSDKGRRWYLDGKLNKKKNTFLDFIHAARHLAAEKYTSEGKVIAIGRSAGGLLMGAVANMEPALFAGIVADVPFVDSINTMCDPDLPLTPPEWLEWGNPIKNAKAFDYMRSYSPYENVKAQKYPAMLIQGGLTDPRVTYWEPAKWTAKLRAKSTGGGPILLYTNMSAGHAGSPGRFESLPDVAMEYAFIIHCAEGKLQPFADS
ncbi:MAG: S9 family peptidase [Beijerinckiaceae bacterium]|nr:S9 family peptidase [Beijerinckiaceae bacterium]